MFDLAQKSDQLPSVFGLSDRSEKLLLGYPSLDLSLGPAPGLVYLNIDNYPGSIDCPTDQLPSLLLAVEHPGSVERLLLYQT